MSVLNRLVPVEPAAAARGAAPVKPRCEACRRVGVVVELRHVAGEEPVAVRQPDRVPVQLESR